MRAFARAQTFAVLGTSALVSASARAFALSSQPVALGACVRACAGAPVVPAPRSLPSTHPIAESPQCLCGDSAPLRPHQNFAVESELGAARRRADSAPRSGLAANVAALGDDRPPARPLRLAARGSRRRTRNMAPLDPRGGGGLDPARRKSRRGRFQVLRTIRMIGLDDFTVTVKSSQS